jgi:hypothetical protein
MGMWLKMTDIIVIWANIYAIHGRFANLKHNGEQMDMVGTYTYIVGDRDLIHLGHACNMGMWDRKDRM